MNRRSGVEISDALKVRIDSHASSPTLDELFINGHSIENRVLGHLRKVARLKTIEAFCTVDKSGHSTPRGSTSTGYTLPGDGTPNQLAMVIGRLMKGSRSFVGMNDLPPMYRGLAKQRRDSVCAHIQYLLLLEVVEELRSAGVQLWYLEGDREWMAAQSLVDECNGLLRVLKALPSPKRRSKRDQRTWHGRPSCHRGRVMPGTSVGYAA